MTVQPKVWSVTPIDIPNDVHARVYLDAFMSFYNPDTRRVSSKKRQCVFKVSTYKHIPVRLNI